MLTPVLDTDWSPTELERTALLQLGDPKERTCFSLGDECLLEVLAEGGLHHVVLEGDGGGEIGLAAKRSATTQSFATLVHTQSVELSSTLREQPLPPRDAK